MSEIREDVRRLLFVRAGELGLNRDERIELANYLLRPHEDITSWAQLDAVQAHRLLDAMEGYVLVTNLYNLRVAPSIPQFDPDQPALF